MTERPFQAVARVYTTKFDKIAEFLEMEPADLYATLGWTKANYRTWKERGNMPQPVKFAAELYQEAFLNKEKLAAKLALVFIHNVDQQKALAVVAKGMGLEVKFY